MAQSLVDALSASGMPAGQANALNAVIVDATTTETISGDKTFSGSNTFSGTTTHSGTLNVTGALQTDGVGIIDTFTMTAAAGAANVTEVTITAKDSGGNTIAAVHQFDLWLSDATSGAGHTGTTASGTVTNKAASGLVVATQVAKKALTVQSLATGVFILEITDTGKTAFKVCARAPGTGKTVVGITLATGNYG